MKNFLVSAWIVLLLPITGFSQQVWTPEQQQQFQQEMEQWKQQFQEQMSQLEDQLSKMKEELKEQNGDEDTSGYNLNFQMPPMPAMPPMPDMPSVPPVPESGDEGNGGHSFNAPGVDVYSDDNNDSTEVKVGKWNIIVHDNGNANAEHVKIYKDKGDCDYGDNSHRMKNIETKFLLIDLGANNYYGRGIGTNLPAPYQPLKVNTGKSWVVDLHVVSQKINIVNYHLWLNYGIFFEFNTYKFRDLENVLTPREDSVEFTKSEQALKKNKLSPTYIGIPLMLRYETNPDNEYKSFHFSAGGFGEYLLGAHTKTKSTSGDKSKQHDDFNLNDFRYGITARVGYGWFNVYTNISLSTLFAKGIAPEVYPWSAGLAFEF